MVYCSLQMRMLLTESRFCLCNYMVINMHRPEAGFISHDCVVVYIKANMKSYIPLETAAIFFLANLFLKQGIG